jgi:predicted amidohydrolase
MATSAAVRSMMSAPRRNPIVAVGQMTSTSDHARNFAQVERLAALAAEGAACLLFVPEAFNFIGSHWSQTVQQAEPLDGPMMEKYRALARERGIWLSLGGFHERSEVPVDGRNAAQAPAGARKAFNAHIVLDSSGETRAVYRKVHLFDVDVPGGAVFRESSYTAPGNKPCVAVDTPAGRLGLATCYDLRFPEVFTRLVRDEGCDLLSVPSAFTVPTGRAHWHVLLRARAIECQAYVLAAAQAGEHGAGRRSYGHALAVDPYGKILGDAGEGTNGPSVVLAEIDAARCAEIRAKMPVQVHRETAERVAGGRRGAAEC